MKSVAPQSISLKPSRSLAIIVSAAHCVVAGAVLVAVVPGWLATVLLILIGASLAFQRRASSLASLVLCDDGRLETVDADGTAIKVVVHPHTLVLSFLVVVLYRQRGRLRWLTLLADSLAVEDFRQLRLWLRWRSTAANSL